ncbi:MAG: hypothetical protein AAGI90_04195 [Chlamydiota bacterium]
MTISAPEGKMNVSTYTPSNISRKNDEAFMDAMNVLVKAFRTQSSENATYTKESLIQQVHAIYPFFAEDLETKQQKGTAQGSIPLTACKVFDFIRYTFQNKQSQDFHALFVTGAESKKGILATFSVCKETNGFETKVPITKIFMNILSKNDAQLFLSSSFKPLAKTSLATTQKILKNIQSAENILMTGWDRKIISTDQEESWLVPDYYNNLPPWENPIEGDKNMRSSTRTLFSMAATFFKMFGWKSSDK